MYDTLHMHTCKDGREFIPLRRRQRVVLGHYLRHYGEVLLLTVFILLLLLRLLRLRLLLLLLRGRRRGPGRLREGLLCARQFLQRMSDGRARKRARERVT